MVQPNLIHPVPIDVEQWVEAETIVDDDFREPVQQAARAVVTTVVGQPRWGIEKGLQPTIIGAEAESDGYVLFRYKDLEAAGIELKTNDRFIKIGKIVTDVYITKLRPEGHYTDQGGATLVKAFFADREPSRGVA